MGDGWVFYRTVCCEVVFVILSSFSVFPNVLCTYLSGLLDGVNVIKFTIAINIVTVMPYRYSLYRQVRVSDMHAMNVSHYINMSDHDARIAYMQLTFD